MDQQTNDLLYKVPSHVDYTQFPYELDDEDIPRERIASCFCPRCQYWCALATQPGGGRWVVPAVMSFYSPHTAKFITKSASSRHGVCASSYYFDSKSRSACG
jgi:hypothetical protein